MGTGDGVVTKNIIRLKVTSQKIEVVRGPKTSGARRSLLADDESSNPQISKSLKSDSRLMVQCSKKRGSSTILEDRPAKRWKMDHTIMQQCSILLRMLIGHKHGWIFSEPVDPVKLQIPNYFKVISHPMDLGTIRSKLSKNAYVSTEDFAADVRLTFSNATTYNIPGEDVHVAALDLGKFFERKWASLTDRWSYEKSKYGTGKLPSEQKDKVNINMKNDYPKPPPSSNAAPQRNSKPSNEKTKRSSFGAQPAEVKHAKPAESCVRKSNKVSDKGPRHADGPVNATPPLRLVARKCSTCTGSRPCRCSVSAQALSDLSSNGSLDRDRFQGNDVKRLGCPPDIISTSQMSRSDPDSDGAVSAMDEDHLCSSSQLVMPITVASSEEESRCDVQLSPNRALRAAMIKERFAHTILKAKHKTLLDQDGKTNPKKIHKEKERLERMQLKEKERIEAKIKEARMKEETELKEQRQRERAALLKAERSVVVEDNLTAWEELEKLSRCSLLVGSPSWTRETVRGGGGRTSPLERLGFVLNDDLEVEDVDELLDADLEEGELDLEEGELLEEGEVLF